MPVKNNDDVAHLLDATGTIGSSYREFENRSDGLHAPLIEAVFASDPPEGSPDAPQSVVGTRSDLLSEVFDAPKPAEKAEGRAAAALSAVAKPTDFRAEPVRPPSFGPAGRSLGDIRRIISRPVTEASDASPPDSLHGVFDRLAS